MCVMSMVMQAKTDEWFQRYRQITPIPADLKFAELRPLPALPTQQEVDEFRRLLDRAREYDRTHNQPDCDMEDKRQKLRDMAKELGVTIDFV